VCLEEGPFRDRLEASGYRVEVTPAGRRLGLIAGAVRLRRVLRRQRPDVVHANGVKAALVATMATVLMRVPVIWVKHDLSWDGRLGRLVASRCRMVVGVSQATIEAFGSRRNVEARVVPNGLPDALFERPPTTDALNELVGGSGRTPVVALVGRLHPAKGQLELVEAASAVRRERPEVRFLLVGGEDPTQAEYARALRQRVTQLGLGDAVVFVSHREDVPALLASCRVLAVPSGPDERGMGREGFGLAGVEAMAVGTPVVGYADGALPEVLGECALLVAPGDRTALAAALVDLLADDELHGRLAACGRRRAASRYRLSTTVAAMRRSYLDALHR